MQRNYRNAGIKPVLALFGGLALAGCGAKSQPADNWMGGWDAEPNLTEAVCLKYFNENAKNGRLSNNQLNVDYCNCLTEVDRREREKINLETIQYSGE